MTPTAAGQIVKFHSPLEGEDPNQLYVVLEVHHDVQIPRARIMALNTGLGFPPINVVKASDLEITAISTLDLIGHEHFISKPDGAVMLGEIISCDGKEMVVQLSVTDKGVETNVEITIEDRTGARHQGILCV